jgi:diadenosine tetraphosphate (Ap4A) HIT family hydrolase
MSGSPIHPQLLADCHRLGRMEACHLLLHKNAVVPWFILVPDTTVLDLLDLAGDLRVRVMEEATSVATFVKRDLCWPRVNVAAIGHLVTQLHLHVIGRRPGDACWPLPVWGHLQESADYAQAELLDIAARLETACGLERLVGRAGRDDTAV